MSDLSSQMRVKADIALGAEFWGGGTARRHTTLMSNSPGALAGFGADVNK